MPKVVINNKQGLVQKSGNGLAINNAVVMSSTLDATTAGCATRRKVVDGSGGNITLTAADSGAVVFISGGARTVTLPDHATAGSGWWIEVIAASAHAHIIDTGADNILQGQVYDASNGSTVVVAPITGQQKITLGNGKIGDRVTVVCDGTSFHVTAFLNDTPTLATS